jgi:hypothetical protein
MLEGLVSLKRGSSMRAAIFGATLLASAAFLAVVPSAFAQQYGGYPGAYGNYGQPTSGGQYGGSYPNGYSAGHHLDSAAQDGCWGGPCPPPPGPWGSPPPGPWSGPPDPGAYAEAVVFSEYVNLTNAIGYQNAVNAVTYQNLANAAAYRNTVRVITYLAANGR